MGHTQRSTLHTHTPSTQPTKAITMAILSPEGALKPREPEAGCACLPAKRQSINQSVVAVRGQEQVHCPAIAGHAAAMHRRLGHQARASGQWCHVVQEAPRDEHQVAPVSLRGDLVVTYGNTSHTHKHTNLQRATRHSTTRPRTTHHAPRTPPPPAHTHAQENKHWSEE